MIAMLWMIPYLVIGFPILWIICGLIVNFIRWLWMVEENKKKSEDEKQPPNC
jgi:hypothetical protein